MYWYFKMSVPSYTRPIQLSDISDLADLAADVFKEDEAFVVMWPLRYEYYALYRRNWLREIKTMMGRRGAYGFIIRNLETDEIIGAAIWRRIGPDTSPLARGWLEQNNDLSSAVDRKLRGWEEWYIEALRLEKPALNMPLIQRWGDACGVLDEKWVDALPDRWHLHLMMVSDEYKRKGFGGKLLTWGLDNARDERVPVTLFASKIGQTLYGKHGFKVVDTVYVEDNETGERLDFGPMMVVDQVGVGERA